MKIKERKEIKNNLYIYQLLTVELDHIKFKTAFGSGNEHNNYKIMGSKYSRHEETDQRKL